MQKDFEFFLRANVEAAKGMVALLGWVDFIVVGRDKNKNALPPMVDHSKGQDERDEFLNNCRKQFKKSNIVEYAVVHQSWLVPAPLKDFKGLEYSDAIESQHAIDVLIVMVVSRSDKIMEVYAAKRDEDGRIIALSATPVVRYDGDEVNHRFTDLLDDPED